MLQNQAALAQRHTAFLARIANTDAELARLDCEKIETDRINSERFARIEKILLDHSRIFEEHSRILAALPETIHKRFGFKRPDAND